MIIKFLSEAYKDAEQLFYNYVLIQQSLNRILREQKFPMEIETDLLLIHKNFTSNFNTLAQLYDQTEATLKLSSLLEVVEDEVDALLNGSNFGSLLMEQQEVLDALGRYIVEVLSILDESKKYKDSIPGFNWDIDSFKSNFNKIMNARIKYDTAE